MSVPSCAVATTHAGGCCVVLPEMLVSCEEVQTSTAPSAAAAARAAGRWRRRALTCQNAWCAHPNKAWHCRLPLLLWAATATAACPTHSPQRASPAVCLLCIPLHCCSAFTYFKDTRKCQMKDLAGWRRIVRQASARALKHCYFWCCCVCGWAKHLHTVTSGAVVLCGWASAPLAPGAVVFAALLAWLQRVGWTGGVSLVSMLSA